jgi:general stress protein 26
MSAPIDTREHLYALLKDFDTAMLITFGSDNVIHARPMAVAELLSDGTAWFVTAINSPKADQIQEDSAVTLTFQSSKQFVSLHGTATVVQDQALIDRLWKEMWKVQFPQGKTDPNIAMIQFTAKEGEYWDSAGMEGLKYAFGAAKAYVTGKAMPDNDKALHAKVAMNS